MHAIILCGGKGTRLKSALPDGVPKPMADVNGKPFLEHLLNHWVKYIDTFVLAAGYGHEHIKNHFGYSFKKAKILYTICTEGTIPSLEISATLITDKHYFVINGDTLFEIDGLAMLEHHVNHDGNMTLGYSALAGMHGGVDIYNKEIPYPRPTIYSSVAPFIDIGTPDQLSLFRFSH